MGIAAISNTPMASFLLAPLQALVSFFAPWQSAAAVQRMPPAPATRRQPDAVVAPGSTVTPARPLSLTCMRPASLRVIRVLDSSGTAQGAGRMRISGRMADVCAELERMAQKENG